MIQSIRGNSLYRDWLHWTNVIKNMHVIHLRSPLGASLSKKLYHSESHGLVYSKWYQNTFKILSYPSHIEKYTKTNVRLCKQKYKYVCFVTDDKAYYVNLDTFDEQVFQFDSSNVVVAFDMFYDEVTKVYRIILLNLQGNIELISNSKTQCINLDKINVNSELMNVHLIGSYYFSDSLFHICEYISCVMYLQQINKWYIKFQDYFLILSDSGINMSREYSVIHLINLINGSDTCEYGMVYHISTGTSRIAFSDNESVVIYEYMNRIYIAQTMPPYLITCTGSFLNLSYPVERMLDIWVNIDTVYVRTSYNKIYIFSMFPISFTASTKIATTLE